MTHLVFTFFFLVPKQLVSCPVGCWENVNYNILNRAVDLQEFLFFQEQKSWEEHLPECLTCTLGFGLLRRHCVWWDMTLQVGLPGSPVVMLFMAALWDFFSHVFYWFDVPSPAVWQLDIIIFFWVILMELFGFMEISKRFTWIARLCHCGSFLRLWRCAGASTTCA